MHIFKIPSAVILLSLSHTLIHSACASPLPPGVNGPTGPPGQQINQALANQAPTSQRLTGSGPAPGSGLQAGAPGGGGGNRPQQSAQQQRPGSPPQLGNQQSSYLPLTPPSPSNGQLPQSQSAQPPATLSSLPHHPSEEVINTELIRSRHFPLSLEVNPLQELKVMFVSYTSYGEHPKMFKKAGEVGNYDDMVQIFGQNHFGIRPEPKSNLKYYKIESIRKNYKPETTRTDDEHFEDKWVDLNDVLTRGRNAPLSLQPGDIIVASNMVLVNDKDMAKTWSKSFNDAGRTARNNLLGY